MTTPTSFKLTFIGAAIVALGACSSGLTDLVTPAVPTTPAATTPVTPEAPTTAAPVTIKGVAASGAPMSGATIELTDATGKRLTTTADADGNFTLDASGHTAPFVVVATGTVGDATVSLVSMQASAGSSTVNVTPITHAIAATLAPGGDPIALAANTTLVTETKVAAGEQALRLVLGPLMTATGAAGNLISGSFSADGTGLDKLLDQVKVDVKPGGVIEMSTLAGEGNAVPVSLVFDATGPLPTAADAAKLPAPAVGDDVVGISTFASISRAFNRCFANSTPQTRANAADSPCGGLVVDDEHDPAFATNPYVRQAALLPAFASTYYLHDGETSAQQLTPLALAPEMNGAKFAVPEIVRQVAPNVFRLRFPFKRTDGTLGNFETVARKVMSSETATDGAWRLVGNQRNYSIVIRPAAQRWTAVNTTGTATGVSAYHSGVIVSFSTVKGNGANVEWVKITGPGLDAAGMVLKPSTGNGCTALTIVSQKGFTARNRANCSQFVRVAGAAIDPAVTTYNPFNGPGTLLTSGPYAGDSIAPNFVISPPTDADLKALAAGTEYLFEVKLVGNPTTLLLRDRLRNRPLAISEMAKLKWHDLTPAALEAYKSYAGGPSFTTSWTAQAGALPIFGLNAQIWDGTESTTGGAAIVPGVTTGTATVAGGAPFPAASGLNTSPTNGGSYVGLTARDAFGMNIKSDTVLYY
jgi:hypothetical protein